MKMEIYRFSSSGGNTLDESKIAIFFIIHATIRFF